MSTIPARPNSKAITIIKTKKKSMKMKMVIRLKQIPVVNLNNNKTMDKYHKLNKIGKCEMIWIQTTGTYTGLMLE